MPSRIHLYTNNTYNEITPTPHPYSLSFYAFYVCIHLCLSSHAFYLRVRLCSYFHTSCASPSTTTDRATTFIPISDTSLYRHTTTTHHPIYTHFTPNPPYNPTTLPTVHHCTPLTTTHFHQHLTNTTTTPSTIQNNT